MYPKADVPVLQLSIDLQKPGEYHYQLGQKLEPLREQGVLIVGSGTVVHHLQRLNWDANAKPYDWALEFDAWIKTRLENRDIQALSKDYLASAAGRLSVPTPDHYYPLLYTLGAANSGDQLSFEYEGIQHASISMLTLSFGRNP
jgi:4,5-DOPA dioxygenase extradiol